MTAGAFILCSLLPIAAFGQRPSSRGPAGPEKYAGLRDFAPGVVIDWTKKRIEIETVVVLREGPLELAVCSPRTREHESVLAVKSRPLHVFQAMGLIGLEPGSPARYDQASKRWEPPRGDALRLSVRCGGDEKQEVLPVEAWMLDVESMKPVETLNWVFAGSRTYESGRFGADVDGTVVCVVDFDTALITVGELHSADDDQLWLAANTDAIPPIGTACTLFIDRRPPEAVKIDVSESGVLRREGKPVAPRELAEWTKAGKRVILRVLPEVSAGAFNTAMRGMKRQGADPSLISVEHILPEAQDEKATSPSKGG